MYGLERRIQCALAIFFMQHNFPQPSLQLRESRAVLRSTMWSLSAARFCVLLVIVGIWGTIQAEATPQFSLLSGNRCQNCHVSQQGGGLRNELGWYSYNDVGLLQPSWLGLEEFYKSIGEQNTLVDDKLTIGFDFRLQMAKSHKSPDAENKIFPMQAALHASYAVSDWLTAEGTYNFGKKRYNGQTAWSGSLLLQPDFSFPQLRLGFFQPSIGMRYDDHTMLVRQVTGNDYLPLIAPNYADAGAELNYEGLKWFTVGAGVFRADHLSENLVQNTAGNLVPLVAKDDLTFNGRIIFWPRLFEHTINTYVGSSYLANGDFSLVTAFAGIGWTDNIALLAEYMHSDKSGSRKTDNMSVELMYQLTPPILLYVRAEHGSTEQRLEAATLDNTMTQWVIGSQIFLLPYVELRPEFRIVDTEQTPRLSDQYRSQRFAMQLHIFY